MLQRRRSPRKFHIGIGEVAGPRGWNSTLCCILDLSETGAKIEVGDDYKFCSSFVFKRIATGEACKAQLVWQRGRFAGVEFSEHH